MSGSGTGQWYGDFPWPDQPGAGWRVQSALESTEAALRRPAVRLRGCGQEDRALRAERSAAWVRFDLDEPLMAQQLYTAAAKLRGIHGLKPLAGQVPEKVLSLARADRGNVQLADPVSGALRIIAQHWFGAEFPGHFAVAGDDRSACGRAASHDAQLVTADVTTDPGFEPVGAENPVILPDLDVALASPHAGRDPPARKSRARQCRRDERRAGHSGAGLGLAVGPQHIAGYSAMSVPEGT